MATKYHYTVSNEWPQIKCYKAKIHNNILWIKHDSVGAITQSDQIINH